MELVHELFSTKLSIIILYKVEIGAVVFALQDVVDKFTECLLVHIFFKGTRLHSKDWHLTPEQNRESSVWWKCRRIQWNPRGSSMSPLILVLRE